MKASKLSLMAQRVTNLRFLPKVTPEVNRITRKLGKDTLRAAIVSDETMAEYSDKVYAEMKPWAKSFITDEQLRAHLVQNRTRFEKYLAK